MRGRLNIEYKTEKEMRNSTAMVALMELIAYVTSGAGGGGGWGDGAEKNSRNKGHYKVDSSYYDGSGIDTVMP